MPWSEQDLARVLQHGQVRLVGGTPVQAPPLTEAVFMAAITRLARQYNWLVYHTYSSKRSPEGYPDLTLAKIGAPLYLVETKTETGLLTKPQEAWLQTIAGSTGVVTGVWRPQDWEMIMHRLRG